MTLAEEQHSFYNERVPAQFNQTFALQVERAEHDAEADRLLAQMRAVRASIRIEVAGARNAGLIVHLLEIEGGQMRPVERVERPPFFILRHDLDQFRNLSQRCGASVLGFLGSMAGLAEEMKLTTQRVRSLRELEGSLSFEVEGADGFALLAGFGVDELATEPNASIRIQPEVFESLRSRELDPQDAFFDERIGVEGDMEIAIGAALAALSPD